MSIEKIEQITDGLIEALGKSMNIFGYNATLGRIFGLLYFSDGPMGLEEMAKHLMVSKATISINIRVLEGLKLVKKIWQKGSRKDYYVAERDFEKIIQEILKAKASEINFLKETIESSLESFDTVLKETVDDEVIDRVKKYLEKLYMLARWIEFGEKLIKLFIESDISQRLPEELTRIEVEWEDEE